MNEETKKRFDRKVQEMEREFGVFMLSFTTKEMRDRAAEDISLAVRFKAGVLSTPSVNHLPA